MAYAANATGPFYHGTRADLSPGDRLAPGFASNYADRKLSWIYFSGTLDAAIWDRLPRSAASGPVARAAAATDEVERGCGFCVLRERPSAGARSSEEEVCARSPCLPMGSLP